MRVQNINVERKGIGKTWKGKNNYMQKDTALKIKFQMCLQNNANTKGFFCTNAKEANYFDRINMTKN